MSETHFRKKRRVDSSSSSVRKSHFPVELIAEVAGFVRSPKCLLRLRLVSRLWNSALMQIRTENPILAVLRSTISCLREFTSALEMSSPGIAVLTCDLTRWSTAKCIPNVIQLNHASLIAKSVFRTVAKHPEKVFWSNAPPQDVLDEMGANFGRMAECCEVIGISGYSAHFGGKGSTDEIAVTLQFGDFETRELRYSFIDYGTACDGESEFEIQVHRESEFQKACGFVGTRPSLAEVNQCLQDGVQGICLQRN